MLYLSWKLFEVCVITYFAKNVTFKPFSAKNEFRQVFVFSTVDATMCPSPPYEKFWCPCDEMKPCAHLSCDQWPQQTHTSFQPPRSRESGCWSWTRLPTPRDQSGAAVALHPVELLCTPAMTGPSHQTWTHSRLGPFWRTAQMSDAPLQSKRI